MHTVAAFLLYCTRSLKSDRKGVVSYTLYCYGQINKMILIPFNLHSNYAQFDANYDRSAFELQLNYRNSLNITQIDRVVAGQQAEQQQAAARPQAAGGVKDSLISSKKVTLNTSTKLLQKQHQNNLMDALKFARWWVMRGYAP